MPNRASTFHLAQPPHHPPFDVIEDDKVVEVRAELPGLSDTEVSVRCEDGVLYISGGKTGVKEEKVAGHFRSRENWADLFSHSVELGKRMDWSHADAFFKDGVLTVKVLKSATDARPKSEIPIH
jgi:HSP20 family protein